MGTEVSIATNATMTGGYFSAPKAGKGPGVLVLQEWWGLVPHIRQVCDRLAEAGFAALAPDLYHGETGKSPDDAGRLMMALDIERTAKDLHGAIRHLLSSGRASGDKVGIVGFCMGGQLALYAASKLPEIGVCVDLYGIHPKVKPEYSRIRCPVIGIFAEKDPFVGPDMARALEKDLKDHGVKTDFTVFPGVTHAFFNDSRPEVYHKETAQKAWEKMIGSFRYFLKEPISQAKY